jgi:hypothetical protein
MKKQVEDLDSDSKILAGLKMKFSGAEQKNKETDDKFNDNKDKSNQLFETLKEVSVTITRRYE